MADIGNVSSLPCSRLSFLLILGSRGFDSLPATLQFKEIAFSFKLRGLSPAHEMSDVEKNGSNLPFIRLSYP